ncbi:MAG: helix-turn-helix transcriptional regulator [Bacteroidetes bacterium]|nr:helix-turn-helix transcriptional regulator [Bacteroidota bacterium]
MKYSLGQKIRKIREIKGLSQQYVARKLRISQEYYSYLENKKKEIPEEYLGKLASLFDVSLDYIRNFEVNDIITNTVALNGRPEIKSESDFVLAQERAILAYLETISFLKEKIIYLEMQVQACREAMLGQEKMGDLKI